MTKKTVHTISDIAELAGVSKSTVSRALNDSPLIGKETRERIQALAQKYNFKINVPARRLSLKQSNTIAFVTHAYHKEFSVADLFGLEIMGGVSKGLSAQGYDMLVVHVNPHETEWAHLYLEEHGLQAAHLEVKAQNQNALRLYENLGFEVIKESRFYVLSL